MKLFQTMCVCVLCAQTCVRVCMPLSISRGQKKMLGALLYHFFILSLISLRQCLSLYPEGWQPTSFNDLSVSVFHGIGVTGTYTLMPSFLCWFWRFELRKSCLHSKHSYILSHLPCLCFIHLNIVTVF